MSMYCFVSSPLWQSFSGIFHDYLRLFPNFWVNSFHFQPESHIIEPKHRDI